jgi:hypothetical protein
MKTDILARRDGRDAAVRKPRFASQVHFLKNHMKIITSIPNCTFIMPILRFGTYFTIWILLDEGW